MKILLTGSSGRVGRAVFRALAAHHEVVGLDRRPFATTRLVGDFFDRSLLRQGLTGIDAVIHTASLHAPQVAVEDDREFARVNVDGLARLLEMVGEAGVRSFVYTSTTALYGDAVEPEGCTWLDEHTPVLPRTIYHRTKAEAETLLERAAGPTLAVRVLRMSRCFPEAVERMAVYRLHRGIDLRDVADAHVAALEVRGAAFQRYLVSGQTPFRREDAVLLAECPRDAFALRCPALVSEFDRRGWRLPSRIDRVYDPSAARAALGWQSQYGFEEVLAQYDRCSLEVLPGTPWHRDRITE
jgi:UDP-glucose 4-epimerase